MDIARALLASAGNRGNAVGALCRRVIEAIRANDGREVDSRCTEMAGDLLARCHTPAFKSAFFPEVNSEHVGAGEARELQEALMELGGRCAALEGLNAVVFALSWSRDPGLARFLASALERSAGELTRANALLMNALVALENIGELEARDRSITEIEKHLKEARDYLSRRGTTVPW